MVPIAPLQSGEHALPRHPAEGPLGAGLPGASGSLCGLLNSSVLRAANGRTHLCLPYDSSCAMSMWDSFCILYLSKQADTTEHDLKDASKGQVN